MNLEEVARRARVSTATVSRVLNNISRGKGTTRTRVMKAVEELKYYPNLHARGLAGGKSRNIGVIVSNIKNPFFLDVYKAVETRAHAAGYEVTMANTDYQAKQLAMSIRSMIGRRVAGLAAIVSGMDPESIEELKGCRIPVVFYDVGAGRQNITNIRVNYRRGMEKVVAYLYSLGHRRMGFIGHHATLRPTSERANALLESVVRFPELAVRTETDVDSLEGGRRATRALLSAEPELTAIVCVNDFMAFGAMREIRERRLRVPEDISVTGFDNVRMAQYCYPALTTVDVPRDQIGQSICDVLIPNEKTKLERELMIEPELFLRDSTGPVRR
jgi:DNA-binding LacI/PurR family transcriptional regulator